MDTQRQLPSALSKDQREALSQFLAGHISAGQFSERLAFSAGADETPAPPPSTNGPTSSSS